MMKVGNFKANLGIIFILSSLDAGLGVLFSYLL